MGTYRLFLAVLVVFSHLWGRENTYGYNVGVIAVVSFFLLSGYVMTALVGKYYMRPAQVMSFYADRAFRIYPQFLFYLFLTLVLISIKRPPDQFFLNTVSPEMVFLNMLILPLGFINYFPDLLGCLLIPPAWTLGLEMCFYICIPYVMIFRAEKVLYVLSLVFFVLACFGVINPEVFGYRLLPGVLFIFLCGGMIYKQRNDVRPSWPVWSTWLLVLSLFVIVHALGLDNLGFNKEVLVGILLGIPAVWILRSQKTGKVDELLGNLSYGVFLNHYAIKWAFDTYWPSSGFGYVVTLLTLSFVMAFFTYRYVEMPFLSYRRRLRRA